MLVTSKSHLACTAYRKLLLSLVLLLSLGLLLSSSKVVGAVSSRDIRYKNIIFLVYFLVFYLGSCPI